MRLSSLLTNVKFVFGVAIILALVFPQPVFEFGLSDWMVPVLAFVMVFSLMKVKVLKPTNHEMWVTVKLILINYFVLTLLYIIFGHLFITDENFRAGLIMIGLMPPAVAIVSYTVLLKGHFKESLLAEVLGYLLSLFLVPALVYIIFGESVDIMLLLELLVIMIVIPLLLGPLLGHVQDKYFKRELVPRKELIMLGTGFFFYILIGLNRDLLVNNFTQTLPIWFTLIVIKFVFVMILYYLIRCKIANEESVDYVLFASFKTVGVAAAALIALGFDESATLPVAIDGVLFMLQLIYLEYILSPRHFKKVCKRVLH